MDYLTVFVGAGIGGAFRHGVNRVASNWFESDFPVGTLLINVVGSVCMGLLAGWFTYRSQHGLQSIRLFLTTGILGGFTTFSAFSLETVLLWERGQTLGIVGYVVASFALSILGLIAGLALMKTSCLP